MGFTAGSSAAACGRRSGAAGFGAAVPVVVSIVVLGAALGCTEARVDGAREAREVTADEPGAGLIRRVETASADSPAGDSQQVDSPAGRDGPIAQIARDLVLEAKLASPAVLQPGDPIEVRAVLRNTSTATTHHVVRPGDGSEVGWREPHVYFTAEIDEGDGVWRPVADADTGRCGLYADDWARDVVALAPGDELPLSTWLGYPQHMLALDRPGTVRLTVHYAYRPSANKRSQVQPPPELAGVPDYEVHSAPLAFELVAPGD